jgi:hypothetical protein
MAEQLPNARRKTFRGVKAKHFIPCGNDVYLVIPHRRRPYHVKVTTRGLIRWNALALETSSRKPAPPAEEAR